MMKNNKKILIVEDDQFLAGLLKTKLSARNFEVLTAMDAEEAFAVLDKEQIACILLDLLLPGADGFSVLEKLRADKRLKSIPVIVTSNLGAAEEKKKDIALGAREFLVKAENSPESIAKKVEETLETVSKAPVQQT